MKAASFAYHRPQRTDEALDLIAALEDARILAGGQSLVPMMNMRFVQPSHVVDINRIADLAGIAEADGRIRIGATTRQAALAASPLIARRLPVMIEALAEVGHFQTRNRGTIGGSLCHLDPAAELAVVAALYDAEITVRSKSGERIVAFADWPLAYMMASLQPDEMASAVTFAPWAEGHGHAFVEFARRKGDFAIVSVACLVEIGPSGTISRAALAVGGADQVVRRLPDVEAFVIGRGGVASDVSEAARIAATMETMDDAHVSAGYRRRLAGVLTQRALGAALARARGEGGR